MIGKKLKERYEILVKIGCGGMANVYSARDSLLNRIVTIKVLKDYLANDEDFIRRLHREAQAAAGLSHPHIVNIYDVGEENDVHFIVMEYVQGKTLKDLIHEKGRIPVDTAVEIMRQITEAIHHAHTQRVIHRDIKPQNILISHGGQVKVTDFGIAVAMDSATVTNNEQVMGSVHYFSPEQAKGKLTSEQSDIYSLGIVFYEMLTGQVPYIGESPISVALKHLNEDVRPPSELNSEIPHPLEMVILKAVQKNPSQRYASAREFLEDIQLFQEEKRVGIANQSGSKVEETENTLIMDAVKENSEVKDIVSRPVSSSGGSSYQKSGKAEQKTSLMKNKPFLIMLIVILLAGLTVGGYFIFRSMIAVPEAEVPDVVGLEIAEAMRTLEDAGFDYDYTYVHDDEVPDDHVISQNPAGGEMVKENRVVELEVSKGRKAIEVPQVEGLPQNEAIKSLSNLELESAVEEEYSADVERGYVIRQDPRAGVHLNRGDEVLLYVSKGVRSFHIRDLKGKSREEVEDYLNEEDLVLNREYEEYSAEPEGKVIKQHPPAGTEVEVGELIDITWSKGPHPDDIDEEENDDEEENGNGEENGEDEAD